MNTYLDRYNELYDTMTFSQDPRKMKFFADAEKWAFTNLAETNPELVQKWLERLEPIDWNNYLSEDEAREVNSQPLWSDSQIEEAVASWNGRTEVRPYYNRFALYTTMNLLAADHLGTLREFVQESDLPKVVYKMAVEKLSDSARPNYLRAYLGR